MQKAKTSLSNSKENPQRFRVAQKILLFNQKKEVLTIRFSSNEKIIPLEMHGKWDFPGGGLEWHETRDEGLAREIREEIGNIKYQVGKPIYVWDWYHRRVNNVPTVRTVCVLYEGQFLEGEIKLNHEHDDFKWVKIEDLNKLDFHLDDYQTAEAIVKIYEQ